MSTMKPELMETQWIIIDGINGVSIYPHNYDSIMEAIDDYGFEGICSIEVDYGIGARLSMPGFLDATEWIGPFRNEDAALGNLADMFEDDSYQDEEDAAV